MSDWFDDLVNWNRFRHLDFPALCQMTLLCLRQYRMWCEEFEVIEQPRQHEKDRDLFYINRVIDSMESYITPPKSNGHRVRGVTVHDGNKP